MSRLEGNKKQEKKRKKYPTKNKVSKNSEITLKV